MTSRAALAASRSPTLAPRPGPRGRHRRRRRCWSPRGPARGWGTPRPRRRPTREDRRAGPPANASSGGSLDQSVNTPPGCSRRASEPQPGRRVEGGVARDAAGAAASGRCRRRSRRSAGRASAGSKPPSATSAKKSPCTQRAARVGRRGDADRQQPALVPVDDLRKRLDHDEGPHPWVVQHGLRRVAETEAADHDVEVGAGQRGQRQPGHLDLGRRVNRLDIKKSSSSLTS